ncbi:MAG: hypothetical protein JWR51_2731 [Devosia sp.]|uniref:hypothetical protein n=1 Tax=Devosia sp. TaxID=1871048 RepID=UPI0026327781|nr:hypothetical protein [Devosia sp.]MDB5529628.1 hypothetical protein [Devosia sp.]
MRLPTIALSALVLLAGIAPAAATGTLSCSVQDQHVAFDIMGVVPHGSGDPVLQLRTELRAGLDGPASDQPVVVFTDAMLTQYWYDENLLNLRFYTEDNSGAFSSSELLITTHADAEQDGFFPGHYHVSLYRDGPVEIDGDVTCSAD